MATVTPTLTISSSDAFSSNNISVSATANLIAVAPMQDMSTIIAEASDGANSIIKPTSAAVAYLYIRHTGTQNGVTASTDNVDIEFTTSDICFARLGPGEFLFMPFNFAGVTNGVQLETTANTVLCEYMWFTKG